MPSFKTPTSQQIETVLQRIRSPEFGAYFLSQLKNPKWIAPLQDSGLFSSPPPAIHSEGGYVRYSNWPASRYLARMAQQAPTEVADILATIETDNPYVVGNVVDAALAMRPDVAGSLVPVIARAARDGTLWIAFKDASDLCVRLAEGGEVNPAMELADALFAPAFEAGQERPKGRDAYWYKDGLKKVAPILSETSAREFLPKLCDWLKAAIDAKRNVDPGTGSDYSDIWRPAIEEHEQNHDYDFAGGVVGYVREAFERAIQSKQVLLDEGLQILGQYPYLVFKRLRLHLTGEFAEQNVDLARETMLDRRLFEEYGCKHEHARLLAKRFPMLDLTQRGQWLGWVKCGPMGKLAEAIASDDAEKAEGRRRYWRFERLHWVHDYLTGEHRAFYQEMLAKCGEPDMADLNFRSGPARWGSESPMALAELSEMTFEEAVERVCSWKPEQSRSVGPDVEGLASIFEQYVGTNPEAFSAKGQVLTDRPALFVRKFITQMREAVKAGREISLSGVLDLCDWVLSRPVDERTTPELERDVLVDKDWQWTRGQVASLIENICTARTDDVPRYPLNGLRERLWGMLGILCRDRPGSVQDSAQDDPRMHDYLNSAINTPRGKAVEAALEYARWMANHVKELEGKNEIIPGGFGAMPEVREMLEWQIAEENRTVDVMAVIGSRIGLIYWIDKKWLAENVHRLFPLDEMKETPFVREAWAAWTAFLVWERTHIEFYRMLKSQFAYAVEQTAGIESGEDRREEPMRRFGEHLMLLHGRGQLGLDDDGGLIRRFIENASPNLRRHTISFVGQSLDESEKVPSEVIQRFMVLWEEYWAGLGKRDAEEKPDAWLFGWWFSCGKFPDQWALDQLEQFVNVTPTPEPDHSIVERLAKIAHVDIRKSVRILDRMIRGDQEGWRIHSCLDQAKAILRQAMKTQGEAQERAVALIDYIGRRGYTEFGQLLHE
ncbi:hypothetical protein [Anaerobaca lacustris]|uniref:Uncharacterized protein n=1 Tax=Anaerobaca lacustris TaxID=3044600 RepID=A0AAW6TSK3_9BACT|nr:hypothetical protein [Sedimentisphaerales bacterium M17dextr]